VGTVEGGSVGISLGDCDGASLGMPVGDAVGLSVGDGKGDDEGLSVGVPEGDNEGMSVGTSEGAAVGTSVGMLHEIPDLHVQLQTSSSPKTGAHSKSSSIQPSPGPRDVMHPPLQPVVQDSLKSHAQAVQGVGGRALQKASASPVTFEDGRH
jgi:hypothetical protein